MKKAAKKKVSRAPKVKSKNLLLLVAVLMIAVVGLVVWAVIAKSPGKTPHAANLSCALGTTTVAPGAQMSIAHTGFSGSAGGESIRIYGVNWRGEVAKTTDSTSITKYQAFNVPYSVPDGQYNIIIVTRYPVTSTTCTGGPFTVTAKIPAPTPTPTPVSTPIPSPDCTFGDVTPPMFPGSYEVWEGSKVDITSSGGLSGAINIQNKDTMAIYQVGTLVANQVSQANLANVPSGTYKGFRVGLYAKGCRYWPDPSGYYDGTIKIKNVSSYNRCDFNHDGLVNSVDTGIASAYFGKAATNSNRIYDINLDGSIAITDLSLIAGNNPTYCN